MLWDVITIKLQDHWEPTHRNLGVTRVVLEPYSKGKKTFHDLLIDSSHSTVDADYLGWRHSNQLSFLCGLPTELFTSMDYTCRGYCGWLPAIWSPRDIQGGSMYLIYLLLWVLLSVLETLKAIWAEQPGYSELCWTWQCPEQPRWLYSRLPLMTCSSATFRLRDSIGPWLASCIPVALHPASWQFRKGVWRAEFLVFSKVSVKSPSIFYMNWKWFLRCSRD